MQSAKLEPHDIREISRPSDDIYYIEQGVGLLSKSPEPNYPFGFLPQVYILLSSVKTIPHSCPIDTLSDFDSIFLTRCGVWNSPKVPVPQRYKDPVSLEIDALKLPAAI